MRKLLFAVLTVTLLSALCTAADFTFSGSFTNVNQTQSFTFTVGTGAKVIIQTRGYAGGGFDPMLALYKGTGATAVLYDRNDDEFSCAHVVADPTTQQCNDAYMDETAALIDANTFVGGLAPGSYTVVISNYANSALGPTLAEGFSGGGGAFDCSGNTRSVNPSVFLDCGGFTRTGNWIVDIKGVTSATQNSATPTVTVSSPNGNESWTAGTSQNITWSSANVTGNVNIDLLKADAPFQSIAAGVPVAAGSFSWAIPANLAAASDYKVRVTSASDGTVTDASDAAFTIVAANTQATVSVSWINPADVAYGTAIGDVQLNAQFSAVVNGQTVIVPGTATYTPASGAVLDAGVQSLSVNFVPTDTAAFANASKSVSINVTKVPLTISANSFVRLFGDANPTLTGTIVGLVNNDNITANYITTADVNSAVGTYPIVPGVVDPNNRAANYNVTLNNGSLIVRSMPVSVSVTPGTGTARTVAMQFAYSDAAGSAAITSAQMMINNIQSFAGSCGIRYTAAANTLEVINDNGVGWSAPGVVGVAGTVQNSQCSVDLGTSLVSGSGNNLTIKAAITFKPAFQGVKNIYMNATNNFANTSATVLKGSWNLPSVPSVVSVTPSSGSAKSQVFQFVYSDQSGFDAISATQSLINGSNTFTKACGIRYIAASKSAQITTDDGVSWSALLPVGAAGTLSNSQCSVDMATSSASGSGNNLTVTYAVTFNAGFVGAKNIYGLAVNKFANASALVQKGTWNLAPSAPSIASVTPNAGNGHSQVFQYVYNDPAGFANITTTQHLINASNTFTKACGVRYVAASNGFQITTDDGTGWSPIAVLGSNAVISNSQCSLDMAGTSVVGSGNDLTVDVAITFNSAFVGGKNIYTLAANKFGLNTGLQLKGSWVSPSLPSTLNSVSPNSGSGKSQLFALSITDQLGASAITSAQMLVNGSTALSNACGVRYIASSNSIQVTTDNGTLWTALGALGSQGTVSNSQCSVDLSQSSVQAVGNDLTLNLAVTFSQSFTGAKSIYMQAINKFGATSGYQAKGTWAP